MWARVSNRKLHGKISTKKVLTTALLVDMFELLISLAIALFTSSVTMLVVALVSVANLVGGATLLAGYTGSRRHSHKAHPFGRSKELYFWAILAAFVAALFTAFVGLVLGVLEVQRPTSLDHVGITYLVLGVALITNVYAFWVGAEKLLGGKPFSALPRIFMRSPMIVPRTTMVIDALGTLAALTGLASLLAAGISNDSHVDGIGAIMVSVVLFLFSFPLLFTARSLVSAQSAPHETEAAIRKTAMGVPEVRDVLGLSTMIQGDDEILVTLEVNLRNGLSTDQVEKIIARTKDRIEAVAPGLVVHIEPDAR